MDTRNILPTKEQKEILAYYAPRFLGSKAEFNKFYAASNVPSYAIDYAKSKYAPDLSRSSIIGFVDTSLRGNGRTGFLFCNNAIYYSGTGFFPSWYEIQFHEVSDIYYSEGSEPSFSHVKITKSNGNTLTLCDYPFENRQALAEYLRIVTGFDTFEAKNSNGNADCTTISFVERRFDSVVFASLLDDYIPYLTIITDRIYISKTLTSEVKEKITKKTNQFLFSDLLAAVDISLTGNFSSCILIYKSSIYKISAKDSLGFRYEDLREIKLSKKATQKDCDATMIAVLNDGTSFGFGDNLLNKTVFISLLQNAFGISPSLSLDEIDQMITKDKNSLYDTIASTVDAINTYCENYPHKS